MFHLCEKIGYKVKVSLYGTLFAQFDQFVMSSESMAPKNPKSAPEAPTDIDFPIEIEDIKLPPKPETTYKIPIRTEKLRHYRINQSWVE